MSANVPVRNVQALEELEGIAVLIGERAGPEAKTAVLQIKRAVAETIDHVRSDRCFCSGEFTCTRCQVLARVGGAA